MRSTELAPRSQPATPALTATSSPTGPRAPSSLFPRSELYAPLYGVYGEQALNFSSAICRSDGRCEPERVRFSVTRVDEFGAWRVGCLLNPDRLNTPNGANDGGSNFESPGFCRAMVLPSEFGALSAAVDIASRRPVSHMGE